MDFYKRRVKFCSFLYFDWNPVIHFVVAILVVFSWRLTVIISGFVYSFTLAGVSCRSRASLTIKRIQFVWFFLVSKQCKQLFLFCDQLVSSINGLRIVCLSRTAFLVVSVLGAGNSRIDVPFFSQNWLNSHNIPKMELWKYYYYIVFKTSLFCDLKSGLTPQNFPNFGNFCSQFFPNIIPKLRKFTGIWNFSYAFNPKPYPV